MDEDLVARARSGEHAAFDEIVRSEASGLLRLATAIVLDRDAAADVVQDSFVTAWRALPGLRDPAAFEPWLRRIVVNHARKALRRRPPLRLLELPGAPTAPSPTIDGAAIEAAMRELDPPHREVAALFYLADLGIGEIAAILAIPPGTVKSRLHSARHRLRRAIEARDA